MALLNMANREVCDLIFVNYTDKKPFLNVDYANVTTTELTGESVYAYGGMGHPKKIAFFGERGGTIGFETQITPFKLYSMITGGALTADAATWLKRAKVTATDEGIAVSSLENAAITSAEDYTLFPADDDCGTPAASTFASDKISVAAGDYIIYYYQTLSTGVQKLSITTTTFPSYFTAYAETKMKTEDGEDHLFRMIAYKCAPQTDASLSFSNSGDPATLTVTCDLMSDEDDNMLDLLFME